MQHHDPRSPDSVPEPLPHVSAPNSPSRGTTWNVHSNLPLRASNPRTSSGGAVLPLLTFVAGAVQIAGDDDHVADDDRTRGPPEAVSARRQQIHATTGAKRADRAAAEVERVQVAIPDVEQPVIRAALPEVDTTRARGAGLVRHIRHGRLTPDLLAGGGIEGLDEAGRVRCVEDAADHGGRRAEVVVRPELRKLLLQRRVEGRAPPDHAKVLHVVASDLRQRRIPLVGRVAAR